jgi:translation initiation factor 2-alpha kinase 4
MQVIMEGTEFAERLPPIFARLNVLMSYLQCFGVQRRVFVNPLSSLHDKFYRGSILFQCVFDTKRRDVFAAGGRYDRLIQEFAPKSLSNRPQSHAVGFNLSSDKLGSSMREYLKSKAPPKDAESGAELYWTTRRVCFQLSNLKSVHFTDSN